jgi:hypothetical protein
MEAEVSGEAAGEENNNYLSWADEIQVSNILGAAAVRAVPSNLKAAFRGAVRRTCDLVREESYSERSLRLLMLLPRCCLAKWAGQQWRSKSRAVLSTYPWLSPTLATEVVRGITTPFAREPRN